jgi:hypothetical protein
MPHSALVRFPLAATIGISLFLAAARADTFILTSGGRIEGRWLNRDEQPPKEYLVLTASGVKTSLHVTQVREVVRESPQNTEYARRAAAAPATALGQWELAEWCREQSLFDQRRVHLQKIIDLEPNHGPARRALGYQFLQGQWITQEKFRRREGFELYKGKWRTPQEIEILEEEARLEQAHKDWLKKLRRYRADLNDPARARLGYESLAGIKDPLAVRPLTVMLLRERARPVKSLYVDLLAEMNTPESIGVLVQRVLRDSDEEMFHYCLARLVERKPPRLADPFIRALKDKHNSVVNRAAAALAKIGDREALSPLIDALITDHTVYIPGRNPGAKTTTFSDDGPSVMQSSEAQVIILHVRNQPVLDALIGLSGANFDYDKQRWRYWYTQEEKAREASQPVADAR